VKRRSLTFIYTIGVNELEFLFYAIFYVSVVLLKCVTVDIHGIYSC